jgi:hypothetical protein
MNKTIGEVAREYQRESNVMMSNFDPEDIEDAFINGANHLMSLPLTDRLTAEEKERVRKIYEGELEFASFYQRKANPCINQQCRMDYEASRDIAKSRADMLESIFGKDFFKEGE